MARKLALGLAFAAAIGLFVPLDLGAAPIDDLEASCNAHPEFFNFTVSGLAEDRTSLGKLCSCLATEFTSMTDAELAMLTRDLDGTATQADRVAFGDYTGLEIKARDSLDKCLVAEGLADPPAAPGALADMTKFDLACTNSELLLGVIGGTPDEAAPLRSRLCECLVKTLAPQVTTADADILATDLDGTATAESHAAYEGYDAVAQTAGVAFDGCFAGLAPQ